MNRKSSTEKTVRDIRRRTRKQYSAEEKIRIVLEGLRGEDSIAELCRREGLNTQREATTGEVKDLRGEAAALKEALAELMMENRLLEKSVTGDGEDDT